ncbi:MAG: DnaD domain protein [Clostridiales bacterium]|jgi:DnaD/phage-associated family protein|nr:DnaD domain protein [Clostridiales bacterium]
MYYKFVDEFMTKSNITYSAIYLYALRFAAQGQKIPSISAMADALHLMPSDVNSAWLFWVSRGLASINGSEVALTKLPRTAPAQPVDELFQWFCGEAASVLGRQLSSNDMQTLLWIHSELKLNLYVAHMLLNYVRVRGDGKQNMRYIEKLAIDWKEKGIDTPEKAERLIREIEESAQNKKTRTSKPRSKFVPKNFDTNAPSSLKTALLEEMFAEEDVN